MTSEAAYYTRAWSFVRYKSKFPLYEENNRRTGFVTSVEFNVILDNLPEDLKNSIEFLYLSASLVG